MWLLNVKDLGNIRLECFQHGRTTPLYAILSHTWGEGEMNHQDMQNYYNLPQSQREQLLRGWEKIRKFCELAHSDGFQYAWVDTCCIDKKSSAELDEAIRSMFQWYEEAGTCYVYLEDFLPSKDDFAKCRWFTRGWTLQELVAPPKVLFYDRSWTLYGSLSSILSDVCQVTKIDKSILARATSEPGGVRARLEDFSIARRMSWASHRKTSRIEDEAYCLLGLFNVYMPIMYGEGRHAFYRLQTTILERSTDQSIFAWKEDETSASSTFMRGLLASSPSEFKATGHFYPEVVGALPTLCTLDAVGLRMSIALRPFPSTRQLPRRYRDRRIFCLPLQCHSDGGNSYGPAIAIFENGNIGARISTHQLFRVPETSTQDLQYFVPAGRIYEAEVPANGAAAHISSRFRLDLFRSERSLTISRPN